MRADLVEDDYVWQWATRVAAQDGEGDVRASFHQSTFYSTPLSLETLKQRVAGYIPAPVQAAEIDKCVLSLMDGATSSGEIAPALTSHFPNRFVRKQDALTPAAGVAQRYAREDRRFLHAAISALLLSLRGHKAPIRL